MRTRLATAAPWVVALTQGTLFGALWIVWSWVADHESWRHAVVGGLIAFVWFTVLMWFVARWEQRKRDAIIGAMPAEQRRAVLLAAITGTPPDDATLQPAAAGLVRHRLAEYDRQRTATVIGFVAAAAVCTVLAFVDGRWYLAGTALFTAVLISTLRDRRRLIHKLGALETPATPDATSSGHGLG